VGVEGHGKGKGKALKFVANSFAAKPFKALRLLARMEKFVK